LTRDHIGPLLGHPAGRGEGEVVGDAAVGGLAHADRGHAQAEEAGVVAGEVEVGEVGEVGVDDLAKLRVTHAGRRAGDDEHLGDVGGEQALAQHALADHAGRAEHDELHGSHDARIAESVAFSSVVYRSVSVKFAVVSSPM
jgi:hypothetical protein